MNQKPKNASLRLLAGLAALTLGTVAAQAQSVPPVLAHWDFERVEADGVSIKSANGKYVGTINDAAKITEAGGGRPGGGRGFDVSQANSSRGYLLLEAEGDANPMNLAAADDSVTIMLWEKNFSNINSSSFWFVAASQGRGIQAHVPWSNGRIYLDSSGCCAAPSQRLDQAAPDGFDWTTWHHYAFVKNKEAKQIYIDGELLAEQTEGVGPLPTDFTQLFIGAASDKNAPDGIIDDLAIFKGALSQKQIQDIVKGAPIGAPPVDTDKDGMPDSWEVDFGFNPNDASDGAKDFDKDGATNVQEYAAGTNPIDVTKPVLVSAATSGDFKTVTLTFSEAVEDGSASTLANYVLSPNLAVTAASVKKNVVTLTTAAQTPGAVAYTVTVNNVVDTSKNAVVANSKASFYSFLNVKDGVLKFSFWGKINGTPVDNLYQDPRWPASPDYIKAVYAFNSRDALPNDANDNYGASIEGFLTPTESGSYRFFIYSDDASQFFISSDDKEANLAQVAEETGCCNFFTEPDSARTSEPVALTAGKKYFVRQVYKEGGGGDYGQIAWRKEGDTTGAGKLTPIPGKFLSAAVDLPADPAGAYTQVSPAANAKGVSAAASVTIVHRDGKTAWTAANVSLKFDGQTVTPTVTKDGTVITISYQPKDLLPSKTKHVVTFGSKDAGNKDQVLEWTFEVGPYSGSTADKVGGYPGLLTGSAVFTADGAGATGKAGDRAINTTKKGGPVVSFNSAFLAKVNAATANDELTVAFWQKKLDVADSSAFTMNSPGSGNNRGFHAHAPWSNQHIYFDTVGCCDGTTQRIEAGIDTFSGYSGDSSWWTNAYHLFVFTKKGASKNIWVDGKLFLSGESTAQLPVDINAFYMGSGANGGEQSHAIIDDFSVYGKELVEADIVALSKGTLPTALPAAKGLIAYWDFNTPSGDTTSLTQGLVAYWNFDGTLMDSVKDFHGTGRGATPVAFGEDHANFGKALQLNGKDQYVEITGGNEDELEFPKGSMSIAGWFKVGAFDKSWQALLSKGENSNYRIARRGDGKAIGYAGGTGEGADDVGSVNDGQWHHFVAVSDATGAAFGTALYVDGVLHGINATKPVLAATTKRLFIGENPDALGRQWNGSIDDLAIWNRVLTGGEVATLWNSGTGLPLSTLPSIKPPSEPLKVAISAAGGNATISWAPSGGTLESSPTLGAGAVWTAVGTANPATITVGNANVFYRVRK